MRSHRRRRHILALCLLLPLLFGSIPAQATKAANQRWCPQETRFCAENAFYDFWQANGALDILGYPIDSPRRVPNGPLIQIYERAIMEWHPENPIQYQVLLSRLGAVYVGDNAATKQPPIPCDGNCTLVSETNHTLRGTFRNYWQSYGGLPVYGFPLTEELQERNPGNGQTYTVQYFERNRFEYHPENAGTRYEVQLGRLGAEFLAALRSDIEALPTASVPNYGDTAAAPPVTPAPAPMPQPSPSVPPVQANPAVSMSPTTGAAGTKFVATGSNFPAGAIVGWSITYGGKETNSGSFQLAVLC